MHNVDENEQEFPNLSDVWQVRNYIFVTFYSGKKSSKTNFGIIFNSIERKSRVPQIQGIEGGLRLSSAEVKP